MNVFIKAMDLTVWNSIMNGCTKLTKDEKSGTMLRMSIIKHWMPLFVQLVPMSLGELEVLKPQKKHENFLR